MSHVDEGTLHAYLDGELAPVERERVDTHLKGCPACQARLAEERAILERASRLLGMATPPERAMPPLTQLRRPPVVWRLRRPLAWAATLILALGLGWVARGQYRRAAEVSAFDAQPASPVIVESARTAPPAVASADHLNLKDEAAVSRERDSARRQTAGGPAQAANNALALRHPSVAAPLQDGVKPDSAKLDELAALEHRAPAISSNAPGVAIRGSRPPAARVAAPPPTPEPHAKAAAAAPAAAGEVSNGSIYSIDGAIVQKRAPVIVSSEWPIITRQPARDVLGVEPVIIPGFAVRAYRRNPAAREIVVEQVTDAGTTISLVERRVDSYGYADSRADSAAANAPSAMAKSVNERLARFVGLLRVEIDGPLTPDSLSSLLELAR